MFTSIQSLYYFIFAFLNVIAFSFLILILVEKISFNKIFKENNLNDSKDDKTLNLSNTIIKICYKNAKENYNILAMHYCEEGEKPNISFSTFQRACSHCANT